MADYQGLDQIPAEIVGGIANFSDLIVALGMLKGATHSEADGVVASGRARYTHVPR